MTFWRVWTSPTARSCRFVPRPWTTNGVRFSWSASWRFSKCLLRHIHSPRCFDISRSIRPLQFRQDYDDHSCRGRGMYILYQIKMGKVELPGFERFRLFTATTTSLTRLKDSKKLQNWLELDRNYISHIGKGSSTNLVGEDNMKDGHQFGWSAAIYTGKVGDTVLFVLSNTLGLTVREFSDLLSREERMNFLDCGGNSFVAMTIISVIRDIIGEAPDIFSLLTEPIPDFVTVVSGWRCVHVTDFTAWYFHTELRASTHDSYLDSGGSILLMFPSGGASPEMFSKTFSFYRDGIWQPKGRICQLCVRCSNNDIGWESILEHLYENMKHLLTCSPKCRAYFGDHVSFLNLGGKGELQNNSLYHSGSAFQTLFETFGSAHATVYWRVLR